MDCSPPGSSVHGDSPGKNTLLQGNLPNQGIEPKSCALQEDSLPAELPGKPHLLLLIPYLLVPATLASTSIFKYTITLFPPKFHNCCSAICGILASGIHKQIFLIFSVFTQKPLLIEVLCIYFNLKVSTASTSFHTIQLTYHHLTYHIFTHLCCLSTPLNDSSNMCLLFHCYNLIFLEKY